MVNDNSYQHITDRVSNPELKKLMMADIPVQLPIWPEMKRAAPNEIVRSALFNIKNHRIKRENYEGVTIAVIGDGAITYTGTELRQDDMDVWLQLLHLAKEKEINENDINDNSPTVKLVPYNFCKAIDWPISGYYYNKLEKILGRLSATELMLKSNRFEKGIGVSMIRKRVIRTGDNQEARLAEWSIWIEPEIVTLFGDSYFSAIDWQVRKKLSALGKWLQAFYQSHSDPYPIKVETIKRGCGSGETRMSNFKARLDAALKELIEFAVIKEGYIKNSLVYVKRK